MPDGLAKVIGQGFRDREKLVSQVARHLMHEKESDRRQDCIHPSEMAKGEAWCTRATYYRFTGAPAESLPRSLAMEMVFETGHDSHNKWQVWLWEMGILQGMWRCLWCQLYWWDTSPRECPRCFVGEDLIKYAEVPVSNDEYLIAGQADGFVGKPIEIKTIGTGTVRYEAPALLKRHSYKHLGTDGKEHAGVDWYRLWQDIRRPFPSHIRQGMIYCFCAEWESMIFIYDPKFLTAHPKEFEVKFRKDVIEDSLEQCLTIRKSLDKGRPPKRPHWAQVEHASCKACPYRGVCYVRGGDSRPGQEDRPTETEGNSTPGEGVTAPSRPTVISFTSTPTEPY